MCILEKINDSPTHLAAITSTRLFLQLLITPVHRSGGLFSPFFLSILLERLMFMALKSFHSNLYGVEVRALICLL